VIDWKHLHALLHTSRLLFDETAKRRDPPIALQNVAFYGYP
jgi:hypothetical protein